jgi:hypothetical protein
VSCSSREDLRGGAQPVGGRHLQVEHGDVWSVLARRPDGVGGGGRLRGHVQVVSRSYAEWCGVVDVVIAVELVLKL